MSDRYQEIYRVEQLPVFQNRMFHKKNDAINCPKGDVVLVQDTESGLIYNKTFDPELMSYDEDYQNEQAVSVVFQRHLDEIINVIQEHFRGQSLIEVGCGKGFFLEKLQQAGYDITGLDPIYEGDNPNIIREYFTAESGIQSDGIILRHVLEHVQDPVGFITRLCDANGGKGKIYVEVPCFDWICNHHAWFDVFYEHVNYFRLSDLHRMFGTIYEIGNIFSGQYLYVVADLSTVKMPKRDERDNYNIPDNFLDSIEQTAARLKDNENSSAVWGGASKGVIFTLLMKRMNANVDMVIDINPAKQGKYLAGTGIKVCSAEEAMHYLDPGSDIYIMNSNYLQEIQELTENRYNYHLVEHENI